MNTTIVRRHLSFSRSLWMGLALVMTLGTGQTTRAGSPTFAVGSSPYSVAVGDFNRDGVPDLAVANSGDNTVSVLLGNGSGGFGPQTTFAAGAGPYSGPSFVAVGDFNRDGAQDLAVTIVDGIGATASKVAVLLGNGSGGFAPQRTFPVGDWPAAVAVGDFNGDGAPDLAVANYYANTLSVLLGNGSGGFGVQTTLAVGHLPHSVAVGDFNADGVPDLAVANGSAFDNTVSVLLGDGRGGFRPHTTFAVGVNPYSVAVGDFNRDAVLDLAVGNVNDNTVSVLLGDGRGGFGPHTTFAVGQNPYSVAVGDFDGDGAPDLTVANYNDNTVSVLLGDGYGGFGPHTTFAVGVNPYSVAAGDFDGDGASDLAVANSSDNTVSVLLPRLGIGTARRLTVNKAGDGTGTVSSTDGKIFCDPACPSTTLTYNDGDSVTLHAEPAPGSGSTFAGWASCAQGAVDIILTMDVDKTCTATFTRIVHTLTVTKTGTGSGTITSNPHGIVACGSTCTFSFPEGEQVALTADPAPGSSFGGWSDGCDPVQGTVTMSTDKTCTAKFNPKTISAINLTSSGNPSLVGQAVTITATVTGSAPNGGVVTFVVGNGPPVARTISGTTATTSTATIQINLPAGQYPITASYSGDLNNTPSSTATALSQIVADGKSSGTATRAILTGTYNGITFDVQPKGIPAKFAGDSELRAGDTNLGVSWAAGSLPAGGPSVGAYGLTSNTASVPFATYGIGGARAIAYATWVNTGATQVTRAAHADLDGFLRGGAIEHAIGAVYVFDTNGFLAKIPDSATAMREFLLGGDTLAAYADANPATLSLGRLFPGSVLTSAFQALTSSKSDTRVTPVTNPLQTGLFTVGPGQSVIIMFDITVYADKGGYVDFASTLKPAPVFLTDAAGNPAPLTPVGLWSPTPPAAANLALTPAATANALTTPVTLTASATTTSGAPVPNTQVFLEITAGPNAQPLGPFVTDAHGQITFTYAGGGATGTDQIQAHIGALQSNGAQVAWTAGPLDHITLSPATATIAAGGSQVYTVQALDAFNNSIGNVTTSTAFGISPDGSCTGATCTAAAAGPHTVTATYGGLTTSATLNVNTASTPFTFQGFFAPIDMSTASLVVWNTVKAGQAVPVKWRLTSNGTPVSDPASFAGLSSYPIACSSGSGSIDDAIEQTATGNSGLQYNGDGNWQFNWKTPSSDKNTCRSVVVTFSDGTTSPAANFKLK